MHRDRVLVVNDDPHLLRVIRTQLLTLAMGVRILLDGQPLHVTPIEDELPRLLATHAGKVLTHREALTRVRRPASPRDIQYLRVSISQLCRILEPRPDTPHPIYTEARVGYRFAVKA